MLKRGVVLAFLSILLIFSVAAQNETEAGGQSSVQLETGAGITPDSPFYFLDEFFERFGNRIDNREEKIAEIKAMIQEGKVEEAKIALEKYREYATSIEEEVEPEESAEAERSSEAIRETIKEIKDEIPESDKKEFIDEINEREGRIKTAAELSRKIKDLCEALAKVDPNEYARVCRAEEDAPEWQKKLDKKLTKEQEQEAEEFFGVMSQCFRNPKECQCDKIKFTEFAALCKVKAPLAAKCQEGDENACKELNSGEDPRNLLPEHLQNVFERIDEEYSETKFEHYAPPECRGAKTPRACEERIVRSHAPGPCLNALDSGEIEFENMRQFQKACEEIMFKEHAPPECIDAGLTKPEECSKLMFTKNAPPECVNAGLTGELRLDERKCREIMESKRGENRGEGRGYGFALGRNCKEIQDKEERLKCFEEIFDNAQEHYGFQGKAEFGAEGRFDINMAPEPCKQAGATSPEDCRRIMDQYGEERRRESEERYRQQFESQQQYSQPQEQYQYPYPAPPAPGSSGSFECPSGYSKKCEGDRCYCMSSEQTTTTTPPTDTTTTSSSTGTIEGTSGTSTSSGTTITAGVIGTDNPFLNYFFRR